MTTDPAIIKILENLIRKIVQQELANARFNRMISAEVTNVSGGNIDAILSDDGVEVTGIPNKTNQTLNIGDQIMILKINNSSTNYCATIKK